MREFQAKIVYGMKIGKLLLFILFYSILIGCFNKQKGQNTGDGNASELRDSGYLFDGKSLKGWKISDFGTQGPIFTFQTTRSFLVWVTAVPG